MHRRLLAACGGLLLVLSVGCGGDDAADGGGPTPTEVEPARTRGVNGMATNHLDRNGVSANALSSYETGPSGVHRTELPDGGFEGRINSENFVKWFEAGSVEQVEERGLGMDFFVRCAYGPDTVIRYTDQRGKPWEWKGQFGLAQRTFRDGERMTVEEAKWVSACLLAHVNTLGTRQYISLRGNPPDGGVTLAPTAAERWTMSYPEGIFSGDIFVEQKVGYTFSLSVPPNYELGGSNAWQPPEVVLGRTLTLDGGPPPEAGVDAGLPRVTSDDYQSNRTRFSDVSSLPDPDYKFDAVCMEGPDGAGCGPRGALLYRPLVVHQPRLVNFEAAIRVPGWTPGSNRNRLNQEMEVLDIGNTPLDIRGNPRNPSQVKECATDAGCVGRFKGQSGVTPGEPPAGDGSGAKVINLRKGQVVLGVLRLTKEQQGKGLGLPSPDQAYTAIVRYSSALPATTTVSVSTRDGGMNDLGVVEWSRTGGADQYEWLEVYPVFAYFEPSGPNGEMTPTLSIQISGVSQGSPPAPELDAVGFIPGPPWCLEEGEDSHAGACKP